MLLSIQTLDNNYSKQSKMVEVDAVELISNPVEGVEKNNLPLMNGWVNETGIRASTNLKTLQFLFLDYDGTLDIGSFYFKYWRYKFYLYTTSSHTPEKNKFRVIIPLENCCDIADYTKEIRTTLEYKFPEADPTGFYIDHFFYIPAKQEYTQEYIYKINSGRKFNIVSDLEKELKQVKIFKAFKDIKDEQAKMYRKDNKQFRDYSDDITKMFYDILNGGDGSGRYIKMFKLVGKYKNHYPELLYNLLDGCNWINKRVMLKEVYKC